MPPRAIPHQPLPCTAQEACVLIKAWPGIPAVVTYSPEHGWSVGTRPGNVDRCLSSKEISES
jgi:hypothetical protein